MELVRILYTINSSPQYILARSLKPLPCTPVLITTPEGGKTEPTHASCTLKPLLTSICRSSPELLHDSSRDFSVYILDPLESESLAGPAEGVNKGRGVAVGLGLMSWAMDDEEEVDVNGTVVIMGNGKKALEVVFALKEVRSFWVSSSHFVHD